MTKLEDYKIKLDQNKQQQDDINEQINKLYDELNKLYDNYNEIEKLYYKEKYKDITIKEGSYFYRNNLDYYSYHDVKQSILYIDKIEDQLVYIKEFIIRDDDGDEIFFIKKRESDIVNLLIYINDNEMKEVGKDFADSILDSYMF